MGYDARFVGGSAGRYGDGHAWVEYFEDGKCFVLEPLCCGVGYTIPRLSTLRYEPRISVSWDGKTLRYFAHKKPASRVGWKTLALMIPEYLIFWSGRLAQYPSSSTSDRLEYSPGIQTRTLVTPKGP